MLRVLSYSTVLAYVDLRVRGVIFVTRPLLVQSKLELARCELEDVQ